MKTSTFCKYPLGRRKVFFCNHDWTRNKLNFDSELLLSMHIAQLFYFCVSFDFREDFVIWSFFHFLPYCFSWAKMKTWSNTSKNASKVFWSIVLIDLAFLKAFIKHRFECWLWEISTIPRDMKKCFWICNMHQFKILKLNYFLYIFIFHWEIMIWFSRTASDQNWFTLKIKSC